MVVVGGLGLVWGLPRRLPKQIPGLGFWTAPPPPPPSHAPCLPTLSRRAGAFKVFSSPPSQSGATAVIKKEHHVF